MKSLLISFLILFNYGSTFGQVDTIYTDIHGIFKFYKNSIIFDNNADTYRKFEGIAEVGKYYGHVIPFQDTLGNIKMLSTINLRILNSNDIRDENDYTLIRLDWDMRNGVKYLPGINNCNENIYVDTLGMINGFQSNSDDCHHHYNSYKNSCCHLLDSAKGLFYNCQYQEANLLFSKIKRCNSSNFDFVDLFLSFNDTIATVKVLKVKKRGRYKIKAIISAPTYNHGLWLIDEHLILDRVLGDAYNDPNYKQDENMAYWGRTLLYQQLKNGDYKVVLNHRPKRGKRRMIGEDGKKTKVSSFSLNQYHKKEGQNIREANYLYLIEQP